MKSKFIVVVIVAFLKTTCAPPYSSESEEKVGATMDDTIKLRNDVISKNDHRFRPVSNQSSPVEVLMKGYLLALLSIDEVKQKVELNLWLNLTWQDEVRTWDPEDYGGIEVIHPEPGDIWRPQIFVINSLVGRDVIETSSGPVSLFSSGRTQWYPGTIVEAYCHLDLRYYPYDLQVCSLEVQTNNSPDELVLKPVEESLMLNHYATNGEWALMSSNIESVVAKIGEEENTLVQMTMTLKRKPQSFVANVLVPVMLLSLLSLLVFLLPRDSGERGTFSTTIVLSMAVFLSSVSDNLPKSAESFPLMVSYLLCLLVLGTLIVAANVFTLAWNKWALSLSETENSRHFRYQEQQEHENQNISDRRRNRPGSRLVNRNNSLNYPYDVDILAPSLYRKEPFPASPSRRNQIHPSSTDVPEKAHYTSGEANGTEDSKKPKSSGCWLKLMISMRNVDVLLLAVFMTVWCVVTIYFMVVFHYNY